MSGIVTIVYIYPQLLAMLNFISRKAQLLSYLAVMSL
jgi:hypothetical protein